MLVVMVREFMKTELHAVDAEDVDKSRTITKKYAPVATEII